jgi:hypothetical protein
MPLFDVSSDGLIPFRQLESGTGAYDEALEEVLWGHLDGIAGERLFRVRRQAPLAGGGRPAVVALDPQGSVVVVHVRQQIDRAELAECLEYAGWARATTPDELAALYWRGAAEFWSDWQDFSGSSGSLQIHHVPRLILVTGDFTERARATFEFLVEYGLPVKVLKASLFQGEHGRQVLELDGPNDLEKMVAPPQGAVPPPQGAAATFERLGRAGRRAAERSIEQATEPPPEAPVGRRAELLPARAVEAPAEVPERAVERPVQRSAERRPVRPVEQPVGWDAEQPTGWPVEHLAAPPVEQVAESPVERPARRTSDPLSDPFIHAPLTAEQLRVDPLGMDQVVASQLFAADQEADHATERLGAAGHAAGAHPAPHLETRPISGPGANGGMPGSAPGFPLGEPPADPLSEGRSPANPMHSAPPLPPGMPAADAGDDSRFRHGGPSNGRASHPVTPPSFAPLPPPSMPHPGMARPLPPGPESGPPHEVVRYELPPPPPQQPDMPPPPRIRPPSGPMLSVVPPNPNEPGLDATSDQLSQPPSSDPDHGNDRADRGRLSDLMDPRMLRFPEGISWDPRSANGVNRDNGR